MKLASRRMRRLAYRTTNLSFPNSDPTPVAGRGKRLSIAPALPHPALLPRPPGHADLERLRHELRTPLTGILGLAELLATTELSSRAGCWLSTLQACGLQMADLIDRALAHSGPQAGKAMAVSVDGSQFLESVMLAHWPAACSAAVQMVLVCDAGARCEWRTDAVLLRQALDNLIANAIRFSRGGQVVLEARTVSRPGREPDELLLAVESHPSLAPAGAANLRDENEFADRTYRMHSRGHGLKVVNGACLRLGGTLSTQRLDPGSMRYELSLGRVIRDRVSPIRPFKPALFQQLGCILLLEPAQQRSIATMLEQLEINYSEVETEQLPMAQTWPARWLLIASRSRLPDRLRNIDECSQADSSSVSVVGCIQSASGPRLCRYSLPEPLFLADLRNSLLRCRIEQEMAANRRAAGFQAGKYGQE